MIRRRKQRRYQVITACGVVAAVVALAACGGSSDSSGGGNPNASGVVEAGKLVDAAKLPVKFTAPGPSFDAKAAQGKSVCVIAQALSLEFTQSIINGVKEALGSAGVQVVLFDDKADISQTARLLTQCTALHPAAIVIAERSDLLQAPLRDVKAAGIPVITQFETDPQLPDQAEMDLGVVAQVTFCYSCAGKLISDFAIHDGAGNVNAVSYWSPDDGVGKYEIGGIESEQKRLCPECQTEFKDVLIAQWAKQIPTMTQTDLRANPNLNWMLPVYDGMTQFMLPGIHAANAQDKVKIATFNADKSAMHSMASGDVIVADIGSPLKWFGYAVADQTLRVITGNPAVADEHVPLRLFDRSNLPDLSADESTWYGPNFQADYSKLWQLSQ